MSWWRHIGGDGHGGGMTRCVGVDGHSKQRCCGSMAERWCSWVAWWSMAWHFSGDCHGGGMLVATAMVRARLVARRSGGTHGQCSRAVALWRHGGAEVRKGTLVVMAMVGAHQWQWLWWRHGRGHGGGTSVATVVAEAWWGPWCGEGGAAASTTCFCSCLPRSRCCSSCCSGCCRPSALQAPSGG